MAETERQAQHPAGLNIKAELLDVGLSEAEVVESGGFGVVFRCRQAHLDRFVAVKVLPGPLDSENLEAFLREERALATLSTHPNVVTVFEVGTTHTGRPYVVMEFLPEDSLDERIRESGPLVWDQVLGLGVRMSGALETVHRLGVVHRDIKPANILFTERNEPQLGDFGIARFSGAFETCSDIVIGSTAFAAPEVLKGEAASPRSDVYSLAATLSYALTGHAAFERHEAERVDMQSLRVTAQPMPELRHRGFPAEVCRPIESAMSQEPGERPASAAEFGELLCSAEAHLGSEPAKMTVFREGGTRTAHPFLEQGDEPDTQRDPPAGPLSTDLPSPVGTPAQQHSSSIGNLPIELTSFVGRRQQIADLKEFLAKSRLVTLTGTGGVGKTRLALRFASASRRAFSDGIWLVELSEVRDPALVPNAVAKSIGAQGHSLRVPADQLIDHLRDRNALLVLDNCEHLLDSVASLAESLLRTCPHLKILTTTREPLGVGAETTMRVPPLSAPSDQEPRGKNSLQTYESTQLFVERARSAVSGFEATEDNWKSIVQICNRLDGLPLPIELAAVRMRAMTAEQILARLADRYQLLRVSNRGVPSRQQTLRLSVDWSYELCSLDERKLWARLTVFSGGFELDAAEVVCGRDYGSGELLDVVSSLVDKSILIREEAMSVVRYKLLETLRDYGHEKLCATEESDSLRIRHEQWYREYARRAETEWIGPNQLEWIARLGREQSNIRVVLAGCVSRGNYEDGLHYALSLYPYWLASGQISEGRNWFDQLIEGSTASAVRTKALYLNSILAGLQGDIRVESNLVEQAQIDGRQDATTIRAVSGYARGWMCLFHDNPAEARRLFEDSLVAAHSQGAGLFYRIASLFGVSLASVLMGDAERAVACHNEVLAIAGAHGESMHPGRSAWSAGLALRQLNQLDKAKTVLKEGLGFNRLVNDPLGTARCLQALAWIAQDGHDDLRAATLIGATETLWHDLGGPTVAFPRLLDQQKECERRLNAALGRRKIDAAMRRGRALSFAEAIDYAVDAESSGIGASEATSLAGLTRRENEVARLVAEGLSNSNIASRLVIAPRTAQGHVEHILTKLGFTSRTQIAAWVIEQSRGD